MRLLVLGGTRFVGRHIVEAALRRGHEVTVFNRGQSNPGLWSEVSELRGDRDGALTALQGSTWDAVIDTSGYVPRIVAHSARLLADRVHYTFVSSVSVYGGVSGGRIDESAPTARLEGDFTEQVDEHTYGPLKVLCERAVQEVFSGRALIVRPGLIVGPHDLTDRFTYWPQRVARGGTVLAPGRPERLVQFIDARDLAEWLLTMAESGSTGVFNATGPAQPLSMGELLRRCRDVAGSRARFVWVPDEWLLEAGVAPWTELPLWIPERDVHAALDAVDSRKAMAAGLRPRPLEDTIADTLAWAGARPWREPPAAGLGAERERELLERFEHDARRHQSERPTA